MRLESAMYSSREGLTAHGQAIAVIGDNISNAETTGYKAARVEFGDIYAENLGSKESGPLEVGSGARIQRVRQIHTNGEAVMTGRNLDVAIGGEGFFIAGDATDPYYTRAGNFQLDKEGYLITADGKSVLGATTSTNATDGTTTTTLGKINLVNLSTGATATSSATLKGNLSSSSAITTVPAAPATFKELNAAASAIQNLEVYDSLGNRREVVLAFFKTASNTWTAQAYVDGAEVGGTAGTPTKIGEKAGIVFQGDGSLAEADKAGANLAASAAWADGANAGSFTIDFSGYTQTANPSELKNKTQNGRGAGSIESYQIMSDGGIFATLSNGQTVQVSTLALAKFQNVDGLERAGSTYYRATEESGEGTVGVPGQSGLGDVQGGALERSTTDLSTQFVDLIVFQRGYQANSQMLNTTGQLIRDTLSLIR